MVFIASKILYSRLSTHNIISRAGGGKLLTKQKNTIPYKCFNISTSPATIFIYEPYHIILCGGECRKESTNCRAALPTIKRASRSERGDAL